MAYLWQNMTQLGSALPSLNEFSIQQVPCLSNKRIIKLLFPLQVSVHLITYCWKSVINPLVYHPFIYSLAARAGMTSLAPEHCIYSLMSVDNTKSNMEKSPFKLPHSGAWFAKVTNRNAGILFPQVFYTTHTGCEQYVQWQQHGENQIYCWYDSLKLLTFHVFFEIDTWIRAIFIILVSWCQLVASMHTNREEEKSLLSFFLQFYFSFKKVFGTTSFCKE